jgi:GABA permease
VGNPLRSEADAFRFLLLAIGYFALIVIGSLIDTWVGLAVFVVLTGICVWLLATRRRRDERPAAQLPAASPPGEHRVLVLANGPLDGAGLLAELEQHAAGRTLRVHVVAPALIGTLDQWTNDDGAARADAQERLDRSVAAFQAAGMVADGELGDENPVQAVEDAVRTFRPDELVLALPEPGAAEKLRERFALPMTHVVVDS